MTSDTKRVDRDLVEKNLSQQWADLLVTIMENLCRLESGKLAMEAIPFELGKVLEDLASITQTRARNKDIEIIFAADPEVPEHLVGDPLRLEQVLVNLTDNAIKEQGGRRSKELGLLQFRKALIMGAYGDVSQELSWLEQAFLSDRNDGRVATQLANLAEEMEEWDLALKALKQISLIKEELPISKAQSLLRQGKIAYYHEDDKKRGMLYARKALQDNPDYEEAKQFLEEMNKN